MSFSPLYLLVLLEITGIKWQFRASSNSTNIPLDRATQVWGRALELQCSHKLHQMIWLFVYTSVWLLRLIVPVYLIKAVEEPMFPEKDKEPTFIFSLICNKRMIFFLFFVKKKLPVVRCKGSGSFVCLVSCGKTFIHAHRWIVGDSNKARDSLLLLQKQHLTQHWVKYHKNAKGHLGQNVIYLTYFSSYSKYS